MASDLFDDKWLKLSKLILGHLGVHDNRLMFYPEEEHSNISAMTIDDEHGAKVFAGFLKLKIKGVE